MTHTRRHALKQLALGTLGGATWGLPLTRAHGQQDTYPSRPVRVVVPFAPGGSTDVLARQLFQVLSKQWGQSVVIDNRTGAGGIPGAEVVAKAAPDGLTLLLTLTSLVQAPSLYTRTKVPFDPLRDFAPISELGTTPIVLVGQANNPSYSDFKGLVQHAKADGQPVLYGTFGLGSSGHLSMEMVGHAAKLRLQHVPYKGEMPLLTDLLSGNIPLGVIGAMTARHQSSKLRPLVLTGTSRTSMLPGVPTFQELGFPGAERTGWYGLFAPAGTPPAIVEKISRDANAALTLPEFRARMDEQGVILKGTTPAAFAAQMKEEFAYWAEVVRITGVHLD